MIRDNFKSLSNEDNDLLSLIHDVFDDEAMHEEVTTSDSRVWLAARRFWESAWFLVLSFSRSAATGKPFDLTGESDYKKRVRADVEELWYRLQWLQEGHYLDERHAGESIDRALLARQILIYHLRQRILSLLAHYCRSESSRAHAEKIVYLQKEYLDTLHKINL